MKTKKTARKIPQRKNETIPKWYHERDLKKSNVTTNLQMWWQVFHDGKEHGPTMYRSKRGQPTRAGKYVGVGWMGKQAKGCTKLEESTKQKRKRDEIDLVEKMAGLTRKKKWNPEGKTGVVVA